MGFSNTTNESAQRMATANGRQAGRFWKRYGNLGRAEAIYSFRMLTLNFSICRQFLSKCRVSGNLKSKGAKVSSNQFKRGKKIKSARLKLSFRDMNSDSAQLIVYLDRLLHDLM